MKVGTNFNVPKTLQEKLEMLSGKEITKEEIITAKGYRLNLYMKINNVAEYKTRRKEADDMQKKLRDSINRLNNEIPKNGDTQQTCDISRDRWICSLHYAASLGAIAVKVMTERIHTEAKTLEKPENTF